MTPVITPFYASLLIILYIYMAKRVINNRWKYKTGLGTVEGELEQTVRAHGNFSEYVPLALVMITFLEIQGWRFEVIHGLCLMLLISRMLHFMGMVKSRNASKGRFYGTAMTFGVLILSGGCSIFAYIKSVMN